MISGSKYIFILTRVFSYLSVEVHDPNFGIFPAKTVTLARSIVLVGKLQERQNNGSKCMYLANIKPGSSISVLLTVLQ